MESITPTEFNKPTTRWKVDVFAGKPVEVPDPKVKLSIWFRKDRLKQLKMKITVMSSALIHIKLSSFTRGKDDSSFRVVTYLEIEIVNQIFHSEMKKTGQLPDDLLLSNLPKSYRCPVELSEKFKLPFTLAWQISKKASVVEFKHKFSNKRGLEDVDNVPRKRRKKKINSN